MGTETRGRSYVLSNLASSQIAKNVGPSPYAQVALLLVVALVLGAHFMRDGELGLALSCVAALGLLALKRRWVKIVLRVGLLAGAALWLLTTVELVRARLAFDEPWLRLALILGAVTAVTALSSLVFRTRAMRARLEAGAETARASAGAFLLTATLLGVVQIVVERPMLLAERFWPSGGWLEVLALSTWAAWLTEKLLDAKTQPTWRRRLWGLFSIVFFAQLAFGLLGAEHLLMTGTLHLPVPAVILAGPIYRGGGFFMVVLFLSTLLFVGPAWCSYLCYFGAMDSAMAHRRRRPVALPRWVRRARLAILIAVATTAAILRLVGASGAVAAGAGLAFGVAGLALIAQRSRQLGVMVHCTVYCPIGLIANMLGKVSPFRVRIGDGCTECGLCAKACRFDALHAEDIARRRPGLTCSLCGDCLGSCKDGQLGYRFLSLDPRRSRALFMALVAALHAVFLGVARI